MKFKQMIDKITSAGTSLRAIAAKANVAAQTVSAYHQERRGGAKDLRDKIAEANGYVRLELFVPAPVAGLCEAAVAEWVKHYDANPEAYAAAAVEEKTKRTRKSNAKQVTL